MTELNLLLNKITSDISGVIWLTSSPLSLETLHFTHFDYLLNGNLSKSLHFHSERRKNSLFIGENYGHQFFLSHTQFETNQDIKDVFMNISSIKNQEDSEVKVLILNNSELTSGVNLEKELTSRFSNFSFSHLNI